MAQFRDVTFHIWDDGDRSVGINGSESTVTLTNVDFDDKEFIEFVRQELQETFNNIHDMKVYVLTDEEFKKMQEGGE